MKKEIFTRAEAIQLLTKYHEQVRLELDLKVLSTTSKIILPKPSKFIDK